MTRMLRGNDKNCVIYLQHGAQQPAVYTRLFPDSCRSVGVVCTSEGSQSQKTQHWQQQSERITTTSSTYYLVQITVRLTKLNYLISAEILPK